MLEIKLYMYLLFSNFYPPLYIRKKKKKNYFPRVLKLTVNSHECISESLTK